jgi:hypothetical protein
MIFSNGFEPGEGDNISGIYQAYKKHVCFERPAACCLIVSPSYPRQFVMTS